MREFQESNTYNSRFKHNSLCVIPLKFQAGSKLDAFYTATVHNSIEDCGSLNNHNPITKVLCTAANVLRLMAPRRATRLAHRFQTPEPYIHTAQFRLCTQCSILHVLHKVTICVLSTSVTHD
jgi:hypothetical protein